MEWDGNLKCDEMKSNWMASVLLLFLSLSTDVMYVQGQNEWMIDQSSEEWSIHPYAWVCWYGLYMCVCVDARFR